MRASGWIPLSKAADYSNVTGKVTGYVDTDLGNDPLFTWIFVVMCDITPDPVVPTPAPGLSISLWLLIAAVVGIVVVVAVIAFACGRGSSSRGRGAPQAGATNNNITINVPPYSQQQPPPPGYPYNRAPPPPYNPYGQPPPPSSYNNAAARGGISGIDRLFASAGETSLLMAASAAVPMGRIVATPYGAHPHHQQQMSMYASRVKKGV